MGFKKATQLSRFYEAIVLFNIKSSLLKTKTFEMPELHYLLLVFLITADCGLI